VDCEAFGDGLIEHVRALRLIGPLRDPPLFRFADQATTHAP
jgi:hypothetical protein